MHETAPFHAADFLGDPTAQAELIEDAFASGDARYIAHTLGLVAGRAA